MNKRVACFFLLSLIFSVFVLPSAATARDIYVRLADAPSKIAVRTSGQLTLTDAAKKTHGLGSSVTLSRSGKSVLIGKTKYTLPVHLSGTGLLEYNGRKYRGEFLITKEFVLINVVDVEDYIRGVLPAEVGASWPMECLKVQAIISRTYGVRQSLNRSARGYDVVDTTSDQVYKGAGVETPATDQAVRETAGEILAWQDSLAFTPFHSDSGGYTATNAHVWGKNLPYLTGVKEPVSYTSPHSRWTAKIPASQIQAALNKVGSGVGKIKEVRVAQVDSGGRAVSFTFVGSDGSKSVKSSLFRTAIGPNLLKSTLLTSSAPAMKQNNAVSNPPAASEKKPSAATLTSSVTTPAKTASSPAPPVPTSNTPMSNKEEESLTRMTTDGVFTSAELMDMLMNPEKRKGYLYIGIQRGNGAPQKAAPPKTSPPNSWPDIPAMSDSATPLHSGYVIPEESGNFIFEGRGWGHGVGLSQWGAQAAAKEGWMAASILEYYYPGTSVKRFK